MQTAPSTASSSGGQLPLSPDASPSAVAAAAAAEDEEAALVVDAAPLAAGAVLEDEVAAGAGFATAAAMRAAVAGMGGDRVMAGSVGDSAATREHQRWMCGKLVRAGC